ncbi:GSCFA domain-containing protein [Paracoccus aerodenitrificans]|uniref:GSCFA domain-containing protein n=1 Tax=Paracoccus aerodenitrificans TaxID=3017781 RepID=UPI0022F06FB2|nr:GSCFA domain-containing protein [Paracoccus aerodenitrificans]WBU63648.1 GSCFA domain-containing protein [Paracoccus aerodenitrificans]
MATFNLPPCFATINCANPEKADMVMPANVVPQNPYKTQPERAFWRASVGSRHYADLADIWHPMPLQKKDKIATAGSCFAQHIGNNLGARGAAFMDMEPAPPLFRSAADARRWGYGVFSCRYGNVYTTRQLIQLFDEAHGLRKPLEQVWEKNGRFYDSLRASIDPVGQDSAEIVLKLRERHLAAVRRMFAELDVFVFTMGLTEGWENTDDGTMFAVAPGTVAGTYDPARHRLNNLRHSDVLSDMVVFWKRLREVNANARMLLTVSPVPLAATATEHHVLVATTYSKSVLRSVAGELSEEFEDIHYFPSYEIISSHPARGMFFEADLRNVSMFGVDLVMNHFFSGSLAAEFGGKRENVDGEEIELICDESRLDRE